MMTDKMDKDLKILFDKLGTEKLHEDFTTLVMRKIEANNPYSLSRSLPKSNYWFLLPYLVAVILIVPFIIPTINWIINIDWRFISFDISFLREWFGRLADSFASITLSTPVIIMSLACSVLLIISIIQILTQSHRKIYN
jgi:hypothetical protein